MSFTLEVVFTGLCLFCPTTDATSKCGERPTCVDGSTASGSLGTTVFLVDAREPADVCNGYYKAPGNHRPQLTFLASDVTKMSPVAEGRTVFGYDTRGRRIGVLDLTGLDLCFESGALATTRSNIFAGGRCKFEPGGGKDRRKPSWWRSDSDAFGWLASVTRVDTRAVELRADVGACALPNGSKTVVSRVRFESGDFETSAIARRRTNPGKGKYAMWEISEANSKIEDFPRVLTEEVRMRVRNLDVARLVTCQKKLPFVEIQRPRGIARMAVSNSPPTEVNPPAPRRLHHFRHYYRLFETKEADVEACNVPRLGAGVVESALGQTMSCPPAVP